MKKILPRILALILCAAFLGVPAYAAGESEETAGSLGPVMIWGTLTHMDDGGLLVTNSQEGAAYSEVVLHGESIICLDAVTGDPMDIQDLKDGDTVYAWVGPAMTLSIPPHATAYLILGNIPEDYGVPMYYEIKAAEVTAADEETQMPTAVELTAAGGTTLTVVTSEAELKPYLTKNIVTLADLIPGTRILVWSDSEGKAEQVLVFPYEYKGYLSYTSEGAVSVNGQAVDQAAQISEDGTVLLPIRAVAEVLGLEVNWDRELGAVVSYAAEEGETAQAVFTAKPGGAITAVNAEGVSYEVVGTCVNDGGVTYLTASTLINLLDLYLA